MNIVVTPSQLLAIQRALAQSNTLTDELIATRTIGNNLAESMRQRAELMREAQREADEVMGEILNGLPA